MKIGSVPHNACRDARQIGRPSAAQQLKAASAQRAEALARRLAAIQAEK